MLLELLDPISGKWRGLRGSPDGASHVIDGVWQVPATQVSPTVGGVEDWEVVADVGAASKTVIGLRYVVNPGDDVIASERLAEGGQDGGLVFPESFVRQPVGLASDITLVVYTVLVADTANAAANGSILPTGTTPANTQTAMTKWVLPAGLKGFKVSLTKQYEATTTKALIRLEGYENV